ncbi:MAG: hypothetical protein ABI217_01355 [Chthoniobacterales bacterium]
MQTKVKKGFDAVAESRRWRRETSALLATMSPERRIEFINRRIASLPSTRPLTARKNAKKA